MDREAAARAIADEAKRSRRPIPRWLWLVSLVVSVACFGALAIAWIQDRDTTPEHPTPRAAVTTSGFGSGLLVGIGVGALAATAVLRRR